MNIFLVSNVYIPAALPPWTGGEGVELREQGKHNSEQKIKSYFYFLCFQFTFYTDKLTETVVKRSLNFEFFVHVVL